MEETGLLFPSAWFTKVANLGWVKFFKNGEPFNSRKGQSETKFEILANLVKGGVKKQTLLLLDPIVPI